MLIGVAVLSCTGATEPVWVRTVGLIDAELANSGALVAPQTATVGVPFDITVTTVGSSTCTRAAGATVIVTGLSAVVTPRDHMRVGNVACTRDLKGFPRTVRLQFDLTGAAIIQVRGRDYDDEPVIVESAIEVTP